MLSALEEITLIARCVATDDRHAFGRLVNEYQESLRRFLLNLTCGDTMLAADLSQETFLKAYTAIRSFRGTARFQDLALPDRLQRILQLPPCLAPRRRH